MQHNSEKKLLLRFFRRHNAKPMLAVRCFLNIPYVFAL
jgi:hypothetical protein